MWIKSLYWFGLFSLGVWTDTPLLWKVRFAKLKSMQMTGETWINSGINPMIVNCVWSKLRGPTMKHYSYPPFARRRLYSTLAAEPVFWPKAEAVSELSRGFYTFFFLSLFTGLVSWWLTKHPEFVTSLLFAFVMRFRGGVWGPSYDCCISRNCICCKRKMSSPFINILPLLDN